MLQDFRKGVISFKSRILVLNAYNFEAVIATDLNPAMNVYTSFSYIR